MKFDDGEDLQLCRRIPSPVLDFDASMEEDDSSDDGYQVKMTSLEEPECFSYSAMDEPVVTKYMDDEPVSTMARAIVIDSGMAEVKVCHLFSMFFVIVKLSEFAGGFKRLAKYKNRRS